MRAVVILGILAALAGTAVGGSIDRRCFAGTESFDGASQRIVLVRELDRAAGEIRHQMWREANPRHELDATYHVAANGSSLTFEDAGGKGEGMLSGPGWQWTGYRTRQGTPRGGRFVHATLDGDAFRAEDKIIGRGHSSELVIDAAAFDCAELDKRRAALDDVAKSAPHACYAGTATFEGEDMPIVLEQWVEPKRMTQILSSREGDRMIVLAINGTKAAVQNVDASWESFGRLVGKPLAWSGYEYTMTRKRVSDAEVLYEGTLGGAHVHDTVTLPARNRRAATLDADAFDCKDLANRRAALDQATK